MNDAVFVDTNLLVYARDAAEGAKQRTAVSWLELLWREQRGRTSMQVLSEYYVIVTRKLKPGLPPEDAWDDVQSLLAWEPQRIDRELFTLAHEIERRYQISWWDSQIVAAAQLQNCPTLLTEDLQDGMVFGALTIRNPFKTKVEESPSHYTFTPMASPRHRRRGRPAQAR